MHIAIYETNVNFHSSIVVLLNQFFNIDVCVSIFDSLDLCSFLENCEQEKCIRNGILRKGKHLQSRNEMYRLYLRENGNLVLTCQERSIWISFTFNKTVDFLYFDGEGTSLVLRGKDNSNVWKVQTAALGKELVLQNNGKLVLYNSCNKSIWEKGSKKLCRTGLLSLLNVEFFISQIITYCK